MPSFVPNNYSQFNGQDGMEIATKFSESLLKKRIDRVIRLSGGVNNGVFHLVSGNNEYAMKIYKCYSIDRRDRWGTEHSAIRFMRDNGIKNIPKIIATDSIRRFTIFEWFEGTRITSPKTTDIDAICHFLSHLNQLKFVSGSKKINLATESCLSFKEIIDQTNNRLIRLLAYRELPENCRHFLENDFKPVLIESTEREKYYTNEFGETYDRKLPPSEWVLSPSDFGFHNAIKKNSGGIVFIDFEYFGWDDPAKLICDFLLHPGMELTEDLKNRFVNQASKIYGNTHQLVNRVKHVLPLYAMRWCMIVLNVFLMKDDVLNQYRANAISGDTLRLQRLFKAQEILTDAISFHRKY